MGLELRNVSKRYAHQEVLHPLSLEVATGEFLTLLGPSGSGKTTVLRLIGGFSEVSGSSILFEGKDITDAPANWRKINLSQVFAGQRDGIKQVDDRLWLAFFMDDDLGYFDDTECRLEFIDNPIGAKLLPKSPE